MFAPITTHVFTWKSLATLDQFRMHDGHCEYLIVFPVASITSNFAGDLAFEKPKHSKYLVMT